MSIIVEWMFCIWFKWQKTAFNCIILKKLYNVQLRYHVRMATKGDPGGNGPLRSMSAPSARKVSRAKLAGELDTYSTSIYMGSDKKMAYHFSE